MLKKSFFVKYLSCFANKQQNLIDSAPLRTTSVSALMLNVVPQVILGISFCLSFAENEKLLTQVDLCNSNSAPIGGHETNKCIVANISPPRISDSIPRIIQICRTGLTRFVRPSSIVIQTVPVKIKIKKRIKKK